MKHLFCFLIGLAFMLSMQAQLRIDTTESPVVLVTDVLLGKRVEVRNVRYAGADLALAHFRDDSESPLISEGILLSTGKVFALAGPNLRPNTSHNFGRRGDHQLESISRGQTFDAAYLEFDFKPERDAIIFNFVFGSEEYTEYVNTQFNDVFAFFISGPGIKGTKNLAIVPKNRSPITVNSVNHLYNKHNYIDNNHFNRKLQPSEKKLLNMDPDLSETYELDGFTTLLRAEQRVIPGKVYHIKISIADVADGRFDSAVFLEANSFTSVPRDPVERAAILAEEYGHVKRKYQPMVVGEEPEVVKVDEIIEDGEFENETKSEIPSKGWSMLLNFDFDENDLTVAEKQRLDSAWNFVLRRSKKKVIVQGHTDNIGSEGYNDRLSEQRCQAVLSYLKGKGLKDERISKASFGYRKPATSNASQEGRSRNRRVEIWLE